MWIIGIFLIEFLEFLHVRLPRDDRSERLVDAPRLVDLPAEVVDLPVDTLALEDLADFLARQLRDVEPVDARLEESVFLLGFQLPGFEFPWISSCSCEFAMNIDLAASIPEALSRAPSSGSTPKASADSSRSSTVLIPAPAISGWT